MSKHGAAGRDRLPAVFTRYLAGQATSAFGSAFTLFAVPLIVYQLTGSALGLAGATVASFLPYLLFGLVIGALADRVDRRPAMIRVELVRAAILVSLPVIDGVADLRLWMIYLAAFTLTSLDIFFDSAAFGAVPRLVAPDQLIRANGRLQATFSTANLAGPALAGLVVTFVPLVAVFAVDAASFLLSALALSSIRLSFNEEKAAKSESLGGAFRAVGRDVRAGLQFVWGHPVLRSIAILMSVVNFLDATVLAQIVLLAREGLGATDSRVAWLFAIGNVGVLLLSLLAGRLRDRWSFSRVALTAQVGSGAFVLALGLAGNYWFGVVCWAAFSGLGVLFNINSSSLRQRIVPNDMLGRVMSISAVLAWSSVPLGALVGGVVVEATGDVGTVYAVIGALTVVITLLFVLTPLGRADRYLPAEPATAA